MEWWTTFSYQGKELLAYTVVGTFVGELEATLKSLSVEYGIPQNQIKIGKAFR